MTETTETGAPATPETDIIAAGQAALKRISTLGKRLIDEWVAVGKALSIGEAIKANQKKSAWLSENFPDLAGQKYASTRRAAIWLAGLEDAVLQELKNDGRMNHPVVIREAFEKREAKKAKAGEPTSQPPQDSRPNTSSSPASQDAETPATAPVEAEAPKEGAKPIKVPFLARKYGKGGKIDRELLRKAKALLDEDPEKAADELCDLPREDLQRMHRALTLALKRQDAGAMPKAA